MRFKILSETSGRMRLHPLQRKMSMKEADILEYYLAGLTNVIDVRVNETTGNAVIRYRGGRETLISELRRFRYEEQQNLLKLTEHSTRSLNKEYKGKLIKMLAVKFLSTIFMPFSFRKYYLMYKAFPFLMKGLRCLLKGQLRVELLDALAVGVSFARCDYGTVGSVTFLLSLGELLEEWTHKKSIEDLANHMSLDVDRVWMKKEDAEVLVPIDTVKAGDLIVLHVGHVIPFDALVEEGEAMINQASMTGESMPVRKAKGHTVYAGTIVEEGSCVIRITENVGNSRYDKIVQMIEESQQLKSAVESRASRLADRLVPYTILGSALTFLLTRNINRALSVLMVDFSCALKLAMPLSVLSAMKEASTRHITVKGGRFLEMVSAADTVVFDKTGTLTHACPKVAKVTAFGTYQEDEMLRTAACLEEHFPHSIATAVVNAALEKDLQHDEMHSEIEYIVAHGISSKIEDKKVVIGSYHFVFEDEGCRILEEDQEKFEALDSMYSHLYLAIDQVLAAVISIYDPIRTEAIDAIRLLKKNGIKKVVMLTGDNYHTAKNIAELVGVDHFEAEVLPEDKASFVEREREKGSTVIMIGDGINDSPALSAADVGIAMNEGASIAREIADITISGDSLYELVDLKLLSDRLMRRIRFNYRAVIGFNSGLILLGLSGLIMPTTSALLHNTSTVAISLKSMTRLLQDKDGQEIGKNVSLCKGEVPELLSSE